MEGKNTSSSSEKDDNAQQEFKKRRGTRKGPNSPFMTVAETEEYLGVSRWTLQRMEKREDEEGNKKLNPVRVMGCKFYLKTQIYALAKPKEKPE